MVVRSGEPSKALRLDEHAPVSRKLEKGEVLVKVQAAALNPMCVPPPSYIAEYSKLVGVEVTR